MTVSDSKDLWLEEWKECQSSIARFDQTIVDLRKYGFSIITGFLTADAFLLAKIEDLTVWQEAGIYVVLAVLIYALFTVDRCFEIFLRGSRRKSQAIGAIPRPGDYSYNI
ncbi:hypothetical protein TRIP_C20018 [Candidatus Zixiibacteriota bacterium]|nr:hypothetical protein TRIP_C20018 [candidate division Zixibacteria bacterium]